ncbi:transcriptional regulator [Prauserella marina]|uniref:DNA-binding transcriptional regulator, AcrR family n=1 Tax=Prauserella marina TaxID=530584 RepID=A0A222VQ83_9PSEU|nr:TetR/AcrR family transcriptional regulator [Prauserella marina]ASR35881.1 transcriptional regulator [Prauserella marina]PWV84199.1 TetR family transcriptional regulator [Prauserella marina]SDC28234.1 DNA-binding transcriptional regulator, AcrR family [Prauserella marina]
MDDAQPRTYGGVTGDVRIAGRRARFIEAGLDLLGTSGGWQRLSVRGACREAGLAARYFYESFADTEALAVAVYDHVVDDIAATTLAAIESASDDVTATVRAGLGTLVRAVAKDPRRGHLLFSPALAHTVLAARRTASTRLFVRLLGLRAREFYGVGDSGRLDITAEVLVGGLAQALTSWLDGTLAVSEDELVDHCCRLFLAVAGPELR